MLQTLLTSCPFVDDLIIEHCIELKNAELWNHCKISSLTINTHLAAKFQAPTLGTLGLFKLLVETIEYCRI